NDYLEGWAPDYYNVLLSNEQYMRSVLVEKEHHYSLAGYFMPIDSPFRTWRGMLVRKEYLDELGMEVPRTPDELY
ncbi:MAG TPA: hypothetical protein PKE04_12770, partial [Clostridia bacterium]|nr:hypothetical protein [Clostridia bacterium]